MKIPNFSPYWITTSLGLVLLMLIYFKANPVQSQEGSQHSEAGSAPLSAIPEPIQEYEDFCKTNTDSSAFFEKGNEAFSKQQYAYVCQFYQQGISMTPDSSWEFDKPIIFATHYAQNPTEAGREEFEKSIKDQLAELQTGMRYSIHPEYLAKTIVNYSIIRQFLPQQEQAFIDQIRDQVSELKSEREKVKQP